MLKIRSAYTSEPMVWKTQLIKGGGVFMSEKDFVQGVFGT